MTKRHKRGDTFTLTVTRRDAAGAPINITGATVTSKMRRGTVEIPLTATPTNPTGGVVTLTATATATALWAPGLYDCDVQYTSGSDVQSSETFQIEVVEDVTY
jgi:hypothetical protein